jgi:hypothetical protein
MYDVRTEYFHNTYTTIGLKSTHIILKLNWQEGRRQKELKNNCVHNRCSKSEPTRDETGILDTKFCFNYFLYSISKCAL